MNLMHLMRGAVPSPDYYSKQYAGYLYFVRTRANDFARAFNWLMRSKEESDHDSKIH